MKFTIPKKEFSRVVFAASGAITKSSQPILSCVRLAATDRLIVEGTNNEIGIRATATANVDSPGVTCVDAKQLKGAIAGLPDGDVRAETTDGRLVLRSGKSTQRIATQHADDYPELPQPDGKATEVPSASLAECLSAALYCASTDATRAHLFGVLVQIDDKTIRAVATNGHCLAMHETAGEGSIDVLVPLKAANEIKRALGDCGSVSLSVSGRHLFGRIDGTTISATLTGETFPPYQRVIPAGNPHKVRVQREVLLAAAKRVVSAANDETGGVALKLSDGSIVLQVQHGSVGDATDSIDCDYAGSGVTIGFAGRYFIDALSAITSDEVTLELDGPLDAMAIRAGGGSAVHVIMPMRIA